MLFFSMDLEGTGLRRHIDDIVELGCSVLLIEDNKCETVDEEFVSYCKPMNAKMHKDAAAVTGLSDEFLSQHPPFASILPNFLAFVDKVGSRFPDHERVLSAYNGNMYDFPLLIHQLQRYYAEGALQFFRMGRFEFFCDTMVLTKKYMDQSILKRTVRGTCSYKLGDVYASVTSKPLVGAHGALADCRAVCEIMLACPKLWTHMMVPDERTLSKCSMTCKLVLGIKTHKHSIEVFFQPERKKAAHAPPTKQEKACVVCKTVYQSRGGEGDHICSECQWAQ